jgi:hypothetical protein
MEGIADGKTYSEIDDRGAAQAVVDARGVGRNRGRGRQAAGDRG